MTIRILPPPGAPRRLAAAQLSNSVGDGGYYVCSALYFTRVVGLSPAQIGLGLTLAWAVGSVAGVALGALADRRGPRGTSVLLALVTAASVSSFLFIRSFWAFLLAAVVYATAQCGLAAARQALLAGLVAPQERTGVLAHLQSVLNAGLALGAALGGLALSADSERAYLAVFVLDAIGFLLCAAVLLRLPAVAPVPQRPAGEPRLAVLRDRPYALVTLLNAVLLLRMPLLSLAVPLWIVERTSAPGWLVSALFVLNTVAVMLFQVRAARPVTDLDSARRAVRVSGLVMAASCAVFALSALPGAGWAAAALLVAGAVLQVDAEMRQSAGSWHIGFSLAPAERIGQYQGFFGTGVPIARTLGPLVLTSLLLLWGIPGWLLLGAVLLAASYGMGPAVRRAGAVHRGTAPAEAVAPAS
ncbi:MULTISPECIES: MFS transporter [unclassified Streptomyces]|uniref:MFS transporter n=1 Tax=unclassified Streptomyces TaxID=2593676 RepID=UPI002E0FF273|nr:MULTISPECIES: MFS transporter [unclassified Streptomyces]WSR22649.1 MFS transporter [Streptomyces sp. NBC_01205]